MKSLICGSGSGSDDVVGVQGYLHGNLSRPAVGKLRAEQGLCERAQKSGETFTGHIEDSVNRSKRVNSGMSESEKIKHIQKGIDGDAFQMLLGETPRTVGNMISICQSYDKLWKKRALTCPLQVSAALLSCACSWRCHSRASSIQEPFSVPLWPLQGHISRPCRKIICRHRRSQAFSRRRADTIC